MERDVYDDFNTSKLVMDYNHILVKISQVTLGLTFKPKKRDVYDDFNTSQLESVFFRESITCEEHDEHTFYEQSNQLFNT